MILMSLMIDIHMLLFQESGMSFVIDMQQDFVSCLSFALTFMCIFPLLFFTPVDHLVTIKVAIV